MYVEIGLLKNTSLIVNGLVTIKEKTINNRGFGMEWCFTALYWQKNRMMI
jgi:hypothetical protein